MRGAVLGAVLAVAIVGPGCKKPNANEWATDRYGAEASATLRREAREAFQRAEMIPGGLQPSESGRLPKPYLVFKVAYGSDYDVDYHRVDASMEAASPVDLKGFAVVRYTSEHSYTGVARVRGGGKVLLGRTDRDVMIVTLVDRRTKIGTKILVVGQDDATLLDVLATAADGG